MQHWGVAQMEALLAEVSRSRLTKRLLWSSGASRSTIRRLRPLSPPRPVAGQCPVPASSGRGRRRRRRCCRRLQHPKSTATPARIPGSARAVRRPERPAPGRATPGQRARTSSGRSCLVRSLFGFLEFQETRTWSASLPRTPRRTGGAEAGSRPRGGCSGRRARHAATPAAPKVQRAGPRCRLPAEQWPPARPSPLRALPESFCGSAAAGPAATDGRREVARRTAQAAQGDGCGPDYCSARARRRPGAPSGCLRNAEIVALGEQMAPGPLVYLHGELPLDPAAGAVDVVHLLIRRTSPART